MTAYRHVVGFLIAADFQSVLLIRKNRPLWMAGRLNGLGGKVEDNESLVQAMAREAREEAGLDDANWQQVGIIFGDAVHVSVFAAIHRGPWWFVSPTDETVAVYPVADLPVLDCIDHVEGIVDHAIARFRGIGTAWGRWPAPVPAVFEFHGCKGGTARAASADRLRAQVDAAGLEIADGWVRFYCDGSPAESPLDAVQAAFAGTRLKFFKHLPMRDLAATPAPSKSEPISDQETTRGNHDHAAA